LSGKEKWGGGGGTNGVTFSYGGKGGGERQRSVANPETELAWDRASTENVPK